MEQEETKERAGGFPLRKPHIVVENTFLWLLPICNIKIIMNHSGFFVMLWQ